MTYAVELNGLWIGRTVTITKKYNYKGPKTKLIGPFVITSIQHHRSYGVYISDQGYRHTEWYTLDAEVELIE